MPVARSTDGAEISYSVAGNAPPTLVFIHGWAGSGAYFDLLLEQLDLSRLQAVTYDMRGHGGSADDDRSVTLEAIAADAIAVADAAGADTFVLVGYSMGGRFAQYVSCTHPDRAVGQVLVAGAFAGEMALPPELLDDWYGRAGDAERLVELEQAYSSRPVSAEVWEAIGRDAARVPLVALQGTMSATLTPSFADRLASCHTPTLVVGGEHDAIFNPDAVRDGIAGPLPNARVELLDCGHCVPVEQPRELAGLIEEFLAELS
jgi:pimeloyl-ACP methyl ester carboxylesterase